MIDSADLRDDVERKTMFTTMAAVVMDDSEERVVEVAVVVSMTIITD